MKKIQTAIVGLLVSMVMALAIMPAVDQNMAVTAYADENLTVTGKVASGTTTSMLKLDVEDGTMQIKIDSDSNFGNHRFLIEGEKLTVTIYRGTDAYMHLRSIGAASSNANAESSTTVSGKVTSNTTNSLLCLSTTDGEMKIKLDDSTVFSNVGIIVVDQKLSVVVYRGTDAYMHATQVMPYGSTATTTTAASTSSAASSTASETPAGVTTVAVSGTADSYKNGLLNLKTSDGIMLLKVDSSVNDKVFLEGNALTVGVYRGDDKYMHAATITNKAGRVSKAVGMGSTSSVSGYVDDGTTSGTLCLVTDGGVMKFAIDTNTTVTVGRVLKVDEKITVTYARGDDNYNHLVEIK